MFHPLQGDRLISIDCAETPHSGKEERAAKGGFMGILQIPFAL